PVAGRRPHAAGGQPRRGPFERLAGQRPAGVRTGLHPGAGQRTARRASGARGLMLDPLWPPFAEFAFLRRALFGSLALACSAAPLGVFLMLRRMSLIGDAIAHGILPGAALGFWLFGLSLPALTAGGLVAGLGMAMLAAWVTRRTGLREDTSLAALYPISLASGV